MLSRSRCPSGRRSPPAEYLPAEYTEDDDACAEAQRCGHCSFQPRRQRRQCTVPDASPSASQASAHHSRRSRARSLPHQAGRRKSHPARQTRDGKHRDGTPAPWQSHTLVFSRQGQRGKGEGEGASPGATEATEHLQRRAKGPMFKDVPGCRRRPGEEAWIRRAQVSWRRAVADNSRHSQPPSARTLPHHRQNPSPRPTRGPCPAA